MENKMKFDFSEQILLRKMNVKDYYNNRNIQIYHNISHNMNFAHEIEMMPTPGHKYSKQETILIVLVDTSVLRL